MQWYNLTAEEILKRLDSVRLGLSEEERREDACNHYKRSNG
jgi:hypothetical protein